MVQWIGIGVSLFIGILGIATSAIIAVKNYRRSLFEDRWVVINLFEQIKNTTITNNEQIGLENCRDDADVNYIDEAKAVLIYSSLVWKDTSDFLVNDGSKIVVKSDILLWVEEIRIIAERAAVLFPKSIPLGDYIRDYCDFISDFYKYYLWKASTDEEDKKRQLMIMNQHLLEKEKKLVKQLQETDRYIKKARKKLKL